MSDDGHIFWCPLDIHDVSLVSYWMLWRSKSFVFRKRRYCLHVHVWDSWYRKHHLPNRDLSERLSEDEDDEAEKAVNHEAEKLLWVEKFAPKTYTDLLSDEVSIDTCLIIKQKTMYFVWQSCIYDRCYILWNIYIRLSHWVYNPLQYISNLTFMYTFINI